MTENEMVGWHHRLNGHGSGGTPGVGDAQGGLACCSSWGLKESDTTERLNYLFLAALGLCCCQQGLLFVVFHGLLTAVASLVAKHRL